MTEFNLSVPPHVHWRRFDDELVVLDLKRGAYLGLNEVAAEAFERIATGKSVPQVIDALTELFDVDRVTLEKDIDSLIRELEDLGLLIAPRPES